jgi:hypothetical protein
MYIILHWSSVLSIIEANCTRSSQHPPRFAKVLEYAIHSMALCSITDVEAGKIGLGVKVGDAPAVLDCGRSAVESNLLQHPVLIILQAFVIYLYVNTIPAVCPPSNTTDIGVKVGLPACLSEAYTWTFVAVAVGAATASRLGEDSPASFS